MEATVVEIEIIHKKIQWLKQGAISTFSLQLYESMQLAKATNNQYISLITRSDRDRDTIEWPLLYKDVISIPYLYFKVC